MGATSGELNARIQTSSSVIEELAAELSKNVAELKDAAKVRAKEEAIFLAGEKKLEYSVNTITCVLTSTVRYPESGSTSPIYKVIVLIDDLAAKVTADGEAEAKAYHDYFEWCDATAAETQNEITSATSKKAKLEATIGELSASIDTSSSEIDKLAAALGKSDAELKDATKVRAKEEAIFLAGEKELEDTVNTLDRAIGII